MADQVTTGRFVGRTDELARLRQLLARAATGEPLLVVIGGEAGVGKTRLAEQLAATAAERGVRVLAGGCVPLGEEGLPFAPVVEALRGLADQLDPAELEVVAGPARQELARLLPDLPWGGEVAVGPPVAGQTGQGRLFELLLGMVQRLAATGPLLWVLEDLHWADRSTRDLLAYLATYLRSGRVLVVGSFRSDELHRLHPLRRLLGELARNRRVQRLQLEPFTRAELTQQLAGLLGTDPPARLVDDLYARWGGNPFFAEELLLAGNSGGPRALPPSLREAVDQQLLLPEPSGDGYVFRHALLAEAVYAELLPGERVRLHTTLAGALEAGMDPGGPPATRVARLAYHWVAAGDQPRALAASIQAAPAAAGVPAFAEAQLQLERALALWDQVPDAEGRAGMDREALLARCAEAAFGASDLTRAAKLVRQAIALVDPTRQPQRAGLLHDQLARCLRTLRDPAALGEQQQAVRLVPPAPSTERARVLGSLAQYLAMVDRLAEARGAAEEAIAIAAQVGAVAEEATARATLGGTLIPLGEPDAGLTELAAAAGLATQTGDVIVVLRTLVSRSDGLNGTGRPAEAVVVALDGLQQARDLAWSTSTDRSSPATPPRRCSPWAAGSRPSRSPGRVWRPASPVLPTTPYRSIGPPWSWGLGELDAAQARLQGIRRLLPGSIPQAQRRAAVRRPGRAGPVARRPRPG